MRGFLTKLLYLSEPAEGFEPPTHTLQKCRSTPELCRRIPWAPSVKCGMLWPRRLQAVFEIRKRLHEFARIALRPRLDAVPRPQIPDSACEFAFNCSDGGKRVSGDHMARLPRKPTRLVTDECRQIDVCPDKFKPGDIRIELCAARREKARAAPRFVLSKRHKPARERERKEQCKKVGHGV